MPGQGIRSEQIVMQYAEGKVGRVFLVRIDNGEDLIGTLLDFIARYQVHCGHVRFIGALESGQVVTGPEQVVLPPKPHFEAFSGGWEVIGLGTITPGDKGPHLHLHVSLGKGNHVLTGCLRGTAVTYIIVEAVITEITGVETSMGPDPVTGLILPEMAGSSR
jgi:uncharacterized protein